VIYIDTLPAELANALNVYLVSRRAKVEAQREYDAAKKKLDYANSALHSSAVEFIMQAGKHPDCSQIIKDRVLIKVHLRPGEQIPFVSAHDPEALISLTPVKIYG
jgi:hypothetical protein